MAIDAKYGKVTTERGSIGADEPVFLFRAQDQLLPDVLEHYYRLCEHDGSPEEHLDGIDSAADIIAAWQESHHTQTPGSGMAEQREQQ